ncbi:MAG: tripartite tricarboxylate transporter substrate binding protein [Sulfuricaulis sp.]|nr:tripartite tricarboxylate transporter substrate binding protein [Sulfuricaulis sp.]
MKISKFVTLALGFTACLNGLPAAAADAARDYPNRPIRMLVPNAPGSSVDTLSRIVASKLSEVIGQQVVSDNRAGAGGIIGMEIAKNATPDGYTLISATTAASTIARMILKKPTFDPLTDYDYVAQFAETPNVLVVYPGLPVKSVKELIDYCKSKQGNVNMASAGSGSQSHLSGAYFMQAGNFQSVHVPYKGGGPSVASMVAGESHWTLIPAPAAMSQVNAGRLRAIGHSLPKPSPLLPNIPPIADTVPGFDYSGWQGFFVPKGTPKAITDKLRAAVVKTMEQPDVKKLFAFQATEIVIRGPAEFRKVVQESSVKNAKVVKAVGLTAN